MDNSLFIYTDKNKSLEIERLHVCTWEFNNDTSLVEFGFEVSKQSIKDNQLTISLYMPWFSKDCSIGDLYDKLCIAENSRFIFNDSLSGTDSLDGGRNKLGVIHKFSGRNELCVLPISCDKNTASIINITVDLHAYQRHNSDNKPNIYFRFWIKPNVPFISMRKNGISKSTIIYDLKVNERRNIPDDKLTYFNDKLFCKINSCFFFNIIPNKYEIVFFDNSSLKNVRTLEYDSFNKYLGDKRVKKDELIVVFNKKQHEESYSFFSIYSKERIGPGQFALAILINIVCGVLLFIPSYRKSFNPEIEFSQVWYRLPQEIYWALTIAFITLMLFIWPTIKSRLTKCWYKIIEKKITLTRYESTS